VKDWRQRACSIGDVLMVSDRYADDAAIRNVRENLPWMHPFLPKAGQGFYAQPPDAVKIDGRLRNDMTESDFSSDYDAAGGFAGTKTSYLKSSVEAFLELGFLRNCLVHQNFAGYVFEKTNEEVYALYQRASVFVDRVLQALG
jgi:hypothetical protein